MIDLPVDTGMVGQAATLLVAAVIGTIFSLQKIIKGWKESTTETNILEMMHDELLRNAAQNKILTDELSKFQLEVLTLNTKLQELSLENKRLHLEVASLTKEVARLQTLLQEYNQQQPHV